MRVKEGMERIEGTQMLLLRDHLQDESKVHGLLQQLEALKTIKVVRKRGRTLSFFADEQQEPAAIIMFLNSNTAYGIYLADNFYLLALRHFGTARMRSQHRCTVSLADEKSTCLTRFLARLIFVKGKTDPMLN